METADLGSDGIRKHLCAVLLAFALPIVGAAPAAAADVDAGEQFRRILMTNLFAEACAHIVLKEAEPDSKQFFDRVVKRYAALGEQTLAESVEAVTEDGGFDEDGLDADQCRQALTQGIADYRSLGLKAATLQRALDAVNAGAMAKGAEEKDTPANMAAQERSVTGRLESVREAGMWFYVFKSSDGEKILLGAPYEFKEGNPYIAECLENAAETHAPIGLEGKWVPDPETGGSFDIPSLICKSGGREYGNPNIQRAAADANGCFHVLGFRFNDSIEGCIEKAVNKKYEVLTTFIPEKFKGYKDVRLTSNPYIGLEGTTIVPGNGKKRYYDYPAEPNLGISVDEFRLLDAFENKVAYPLSRECGIDLVAVHNPSADQYFVFLFLSKGTAPKMFWFGAIFNQDWTEDVLQVLVERYGKPKIGGHQDMGQLRDYLWKICSIDVGLRAHIWQSPADAASGDPLKGQFYASHLLAVDMPVFKEAINVIKQERQKQQNAREAKKQEELKKEETARQLRRGKI